MKEGMIKPIGNLFMIVIFILAITVIFIENKIAFGVAFIGLGFILLGIVHLNGIRLRSIYPNIIFGFIDDSLLVVTSTLGGFFAGVGGAIVGGAAGNAITDGIAGLFEGKMAEDMKVHHIKENRSAMATMFGKVIGCLFGAGTMILLIWIIRQILKF